MNIAWMQPPVAALALALMVSMAAAQTPPPKEVTNDVPDPRQMAKIVGAVDAGLEYLVRQQRPDGSWPSFWESNTGINGICLLAFLGRGHVPGRGPFKEVVGRAVGFILNSQDERGLYTSPDPSHGPMYAHALATLAMIEAWGWMPEPRVQNSVQKAVTLILKAQATEPEHAGGWRYPPYPEDADLNVTVMQLVALRAARNARIEVPDKTFERALDYVRRCGTTEFGPFVYQPGRRVSTSLIAAGSLSMQLLGAGEDPLVRTALKRLRARPYNTRMDHFWYTTYYAMQTARQAGGPFWSYWHPKARKVILEAQNQDGSWPGFEDEKYNGPARCYSTAFACISLEVYMHYLPAYQRSAE